MTIGCHRTEQARRANLLKIAKYKGKPCQTEPRINCTKSNSVSTIPEHFVETKVCSRIMCIELNQRRKMKRGNKREFKPLTLLSQCTLLNSFVAMQQDG